MTELVRRFREQELEIAMTWMVPGSKVLEIGAGAGWQAKILAQRGFEVEAVDVAGDPRRDSRVWPVTEYDGHHLPFEDHLFDLVFSSNVLEHVRHVSDFQQEILRVLKPGGRTIHVLPSATWRLWTSVSHYPHLLERRGAQLAEALGRRPPRSAFSRIFRVLIATVPELLPPRHGERGNALTEIYSFSRFFWRPFFQRHGWRLLRIRPNRLLYTGHQVLGNSLTLAWRRRLSRVLGSTCLFYVLEPVSR